MTNDKNSGCNADCTSPSEQLNTDCFCTTLNREQLDNILRADDINQDVLATHPQLFSNTTVFISPAQLRQMRDIVHAVSRAVNLPAYVQDVLTRAPTIASYNPGTSGVFMGYGIIQSIAPMITGKVSGKIPDGRSALWWAVLLAVVTAAIAYVLMMHISPAIVLIIGLMIFGIVFTVCLFDS